MINQSVQIIGKNPKEIRKDYVLINAYSHSYSFEQIGTVIAFLVIIVMHSVFIVSSMAVFDKPILWILLSITYILLLVMVYDYCGLTCLDPVDDLVLGIKKQSYKQQDLVYCMRCKVSVHRCSYHCNNCNRCVQYFDHHCRYLNNCIGGKNYHRFLRLLLTVTVFCLTIIGEGVWIFIVSFSDYNLNDRIISNWTVLATIIVAFLLMVSVDTLLFFHLYLTCCLKKSTFDYLMSRTESEGQAYTSQQQMDTQP